MTTKDFVQQTNLQMIWEVIIDEEMFRFLNQEMQTKVHNMFLSNLQGFYEAERTRTQTLVDMNKKYILLILRYIKTNFQSMPSKIRIHADESSSSPRPLPPQAKDLVTFEEIHQEKKSQFERDLQQRREEFDGYMNVQTPDTPTFADKDKDQPIKEMDKILKEMQVQRNYEIEQIRTFTQGEEPSNWLTAQETSVKKKNVSFDLEEKPIIKYAFSEENETLEPHEDLEETLLFSKLKKQEGKESSDRIALLEQEMREMHNKINILLDMVQRKN